MTSESSLPPPRIGLPVGAPLLLREDRREVELPRLADHLHAEEALLLRAERDELVPRKSEIRVPHLDLLDHLVLEALIPKLDPVLERHLRLGVVLDLDLHLLADRSGEVDLELLPHVELGELPLAAALVVPVHDEVLRLSRERDRLAPRDLDVRPLADDPRQGLREADRKVDVEHPRIHAPCRARPHRAVVLDPIPACSVVAKSLSVLVHRGDPRVDERNPAERVLGDDSVSLPIDAEGRLDPLLGELEERPVGFRIGGEERAAEEGGMVPVNRLTDQRERRAARHVGSPARAERRFRADAGEKECGGDPAGRSTARSETHHGFLAPKKHPLPGEKEEARCRGFSDRDAPLWFIMGEPHGVLCGKGQGACHIRPVPVLDLRARPAVVLQQPIEEQLVTRIARRSSHGQRPPRLHRRTHTATPCPSRGTRRERGCRSPILSIR